MTAFSAAYSGSVIKSIQYVSLSGTGNGSNGTVTITSVNTAKAVVIKLGEYNSTNVGRGSFVALTLTNSTTVTGTFATGSATTSDTIVANAVVVEFN